ncbi:MAG TPA: hypothetical protein VMV20_06035 [Chitinophagaceae bacterium]|nr:hypothetical protein [Chitinophagaceae bacterium]
MDRTLPLNRYRMFVVCAILLALFQGRPAWSQNSGMKDSYHSLQQKAERTARLLTAKLRLTPTQTAGIRQANLVLLRRLKPVQDNPAIPGADAMKKAATRRLDSAYRQILTPSEYRQLTGAPHPGT